MFTSTATTSRGMDSSRHGNAAHRLAEAALRAPSRPAVVQCRGVETNGGRGCRAISFAELENLTCRYAQALTAEGFGRGMRVLLMVRPGVDFLATTFALFKLGAVPVMIDPGMGLRRMLDCLGGAGIQGLVAVPAGHAMRLMRPGLFRDCRALVTVGRRRLPGARSLLALAQRTNGSFKSVDTRPDETAAILFTSGSTGPAKGVVYQHRMFDAQVDMIGSMYGFGEDEVDVSCFPLFALFSVAMGVTVVLPRMDASRPARVEPARIVAAIRNHEATSSFGSPAVWRKVAAFCVERGVRLPSLRRVLIAGAPVPVQTIEQLHQVLGPSADVHTPYGATEALPVSTISGREVVQECAEQTRKGGGTCVGSVADGIQARVIGISDEPIERWSENLVVADGEIGEIVVSGRPVTRTYHQRPDANAVSKVADGDRVWHRMGDVGYRDGRGRLWFCGRKSHRVTTADGVLFADQCEAVFNEHDRVARTALVGVGRGPHQRAVLIVEPRAGNWPRGRNDREQFAGELMAIGGACDRTRSIRHFLFRRSLPVDVRHNAKINREALAQWAATRVAIAGRTAGSTA